MGANLRFAILALWTGILCLASVAQDTTKAFDRELKKYVNCNVSASRSIARQEGDLISLALAARGMCTREYAALSTALRRVYRPALVLRLLDRARSRQLESNAAAIAVVRRSSSSSSPKLPTGQSVSFGTGFYVSQEGHIITNDHVVRGCRSALIGQPAQASRVALIVARDPINDLALLSTSKAPAAVPAFKLTVQTGEAIAVYGFPFGGLLSTSGNFTMGNVTAAVGWEDNPRYLQVSAPIQPGNSGGPLMDERGNIVGVVVAQMRPGVAQNVNFAVKASIALGFLDRNGIPAGSTPSNVAPLSPVDLAERAQRFTVMIACEPEKDAGPTPDAVKRFRVQESVSQGILNMRAGPGQGHRIVIPIPAGTRGIKVKRCRDPDDGGRGPRWCEAAWRQYSGWISSCCLQPDEDETAE